MCIVTHGRDSTDTLHGEDFADTLNVQDSTDTLHGPKSTDTFLSKIYMWLTLHPLPFFLWLRYNRQFFVAIIYRIRV
jgi:hypothetical protein